MNQLDCTPKRRRFQHLNYEERKVIERMLRSRASKTEIARVLKRNISTIRREIKRGIVKQRRTNINFSKKIEVPEYIEYEIYFADVGQAEYEKNRKNCGAKNKVLECIEFVKFFEKQILSKMKWSPETCVGYAKRENLFDNIVSAKTIYNWIDAGLVKVKNLDLLLKVKRKPKSKIRIRKKVLGKSIEERPQIVDAREEFGHWEGDGIVGANHKGHLITLVERKTRVGFIFNVKDKKDVRIVDVIQILKTHYKEKFKEIFKTITFDNGSEFARSDLLEADGELKIYYAHPYSSFERGTNENWNGIVRRYIPKGKSFDNIKNEDLARIANYINTMPRKSFNFKTPIELFKEEVLCIVV